MTKDEALKMAIKAMENSIVRCKDLHHAKKDQNKDSGQCPVEQRWNATIQACKEALEPQIELADTISVEDYQKLREQPKNTQPLDEVIEEFMKDPAMKQAMDKAREKLSPLFSHPTPQTTQEHSMTYEDGFAHGYDAHLADYKEQPTQEPVAWMHCVDEDITEFNDFQACPKCEPLYTHPKEWQGLSDDEIEEALSGTDPNFIHGSCTQGILWAEAKLKEKNG